MFLLCHPWLTTTNLSYRLRILETSATALCGTTGIFDKFCVFLLCGFCRWLRLLKVYSVLVFRWLGLKAQSLFTMTSLVCGGDQPSSMTYFKVKESDRPASSCFVSHPVSQFCRFRTPCCFFVDIFSDFFRINFEPPHAGGLQSDGRPSGCWSDDCGNTAIWLDQFQFQSYDSMPHNMSTIINSNQRKFRSQSSDNMEKWKAEKRRV